MALMITTVPPQVIALDFKSFTGGAEILKILSFF